MSPAEPARPTVGRRVEEDSADRGVFVRYDLAGDETSPCIVMLASAGREASDFNELAVSVSAAGFRVCLVQPPFVDGARSSVDTPDLFDLAQDVASIIPAGHVVMLGHAFGNRVARAFATAYPERTRGVILLAAGGLRPIAREANAALVGCFDPNAETATHMKHVRYGFFSGNNPIPDYWIRGWHAKTAQIQGAATRSTDVTLWWGAGEAKILVVTGLNDTIAPPADTIDMLEKDYPDRVTAVRVPNAGHALLPEQPAKVESAVLEFLSELAGEA